MKQNARNGVSLPLFDEGLAHVEALVRGRPLLGFDYDGTLAPIVRDPRQASMRDSTRALFSEVIERFPCVVISGRAREDVARLLGDCRPLAIIGNHGIETDDEDVPPPPDTLLSAWHAELDERLETTPGIRIEDKAYSLTLHYRDSPEPIAARARALSAVKSLDAVRVITGVWSLNLLPEGFPHKGTALLRAAAKAQCDTALFVGDDRTDEDAFGVAPDRVVGIRVGQPARSAARYYLPGQPDIDRLLELLLRLRARRAH